jgi:anti-anti-sigma factor
VQLNVIQQDNATLLVPSGRLDQASSDPFLQAVLAELSDRTAASTPLVLDFSAVDYIASVGLRALMVAARQAKAGGGGIGIAALQPMVREVFSIARFDLVIPCFDSVESAARELCA